MSKRDEIARHLSVRWRDTWEDDKAFFTARADSVLALLEPDDAMVEAAARAAMKVYFKVDVPEWENLSKENRAMWMEEARAALKAGLRVAKGEI